MLRPLSLIALAALVPALAATPAAAAPSGTVVASARANHFDGDDVAVSALGGIAGLGFGLLVGGAVGEAAAGSCVERDDDTSLFGDCFLHGVGETVLGASIGGTLGAAGGVYMVGELTGHDGSFAATLGGSSLGTLAGFGFIALAGDVDDDVQSGILTGLGLALPVAGALVAYGLSNDPHDDDTGVTSGALLDLSRDGHLRLAVPAVGLSLPREGEVVVALPLLGGAL